MGKQPFELEGFKKKTKSIMIRIDEDTYNFVEKECKRKNLTFTMFFRGALKYAIDNYKKGE